MEINITFKSLLQPIKDVAKRNEAFKNLTQEGKRLEIAWEALQLLLSETIKPAGEGRRSSFYWSERLDNILWKTKSSTDLQNKLLKEKNCRVCARGAITLSKIRLGNAVDMSASFTKINCGSEQTARDGFSSQSMEQMEAQYEKCRYMGTFAMNTKENMANILCNVLVNGNYKPRDKTIYITP